MSELCGLNLVILWKRDDGLHNPDMLLEPLRRQNVPKSCISTCFPANSEQLLMSLGGVGFGLVTSNLALLVVVSIGGY